MVQRQDATKINKGGLLCLLVLSSVLIGTAEKVAHLLVMMSTTNAHDVATRIMELSTVLKLRKNIALTLSNPEAWDFLLLDLSLSSKYPNLMTSLCQGFDNTVTPNNHHSLHDHADKCYQIIQKEFE